MTKDQANEIINLLKEQNERLKDLQQTEHNNNDLLNLIDSNQPN